MTAPHIRHGRRVGGRLPSPPTTPAPEPAARRPALDHIDRQETTP